MPEQPRDARPTDPDPGASASEEFGWHVPDDSPPSEPSAPEPSAGWHTPEPAGISPSAPPPVPAADSGPAPAAPDAGEPVGWHAPPGVAPALAETGDWAADEGGWHVPISAGADRLLEGVTDTIVPRPEPAPTAEETTYAMPVGLEVPAEVEAVEEEVAAAVEEAAVAAEAAPEGELSPAAVAAAKLAELEAQEAAVEEAEAEVAEPPLAEEDSGLRRLVTQFDNVEGQVRGLRARFQTGELSREALQSELRKLMILDPQGNWWMIGVESDVWYTYEGGQWVARSRPRLAPSAEPTLTEDTLPRVPRFPDTHDIVLDEYGMPVRRVPVDDLEATMVGSTASHFDETPLGGERTLPHDAYAQPTLGATALSPGAATREHAIVPGQPTQPVPARPGDYSVPATYTPSPTVLQAQEMQARQAQRWLVRTVFVAVISLLVIGLIVILGAVLFYTNRVSVYSERIEQLAAIAAQFETTIIYDRNGNPLAQINDPTGGTRISVNLADISPYVIHASIATENERFYDDPGWDPIAIVRAVIQNVQAGDIVSGASTITQQLARTLVLDPEQRTDISVGRKIDEVIIAAEIGRRYSKNEILELYLNEIYYGHLAYGIEAAAQTYFGVSARELNLPQAAFLIGLVGAPATYDPVSNREGAFARMDSVINLMLAAGCIRFQHEPYASQGPFCVTQADVDAAVVQQAEVEVREYELPENTWRYPHFVNYVVQQLEENYGLADIYRAGFNVVTTIDPAIQDAAQAVVNEQLAELRARGIGGNNASVVVMDPRNGDILAMVGSADYNNEDIDGQVNVALTAQQPGSAIKPVVYVTAFQTDPSTGQYWTPATILWDTPTCWGGYCPTNYDRAYHGPQAVRYALGNSYNIPAVKTMEYVTPERFAQTAQAMGLTFPGATPQQAGLPGAIGAFDVRLIDMVVAYGVLANNGQRVMPNVILRIQDNDGNNVPVPPHPEPVQVIQPEHAYMISNILSDDQARAAGFGRGTLLNIPGYTVAVKTGTTNDNRDNWTIGYTPTVVVGVWHGNTDNSPMRGTSGFSGAAPIWNRVMTAALSGRPVVDFPVPQGIVVVEICDYSGTLPPERCTSEFRRREIFAQAQPPPGIEQDLLVPVRVNTVSGLRANDFCPNFVEEQTFLNVQDATAVDWINGTAAGQNWAARLGLTLPVRAVPTAACDASTRQPNIVLEQPAAGVEVRGLVEVRGTVDIFDFRSYVLQYGVGSAPQTWEVADGPYTLQHRGASELLGTWDVTTLQNGTYTLRLRVENLTNGYAIVNRTVTVFNPLVLTDTPTPTVTSTPPPPVTIITLTPTPTWTPLVSISATPVTPPQAPTVALTALPPFDPGQVIQIEYGAQATGFLTSQQYWAYYRFIGQANDQIVIDVRRTAGDLDTYVYLMDASGVNILGEDDDTGEGTDSQLIFTLPASDTYVIVVTRFDVAAGVTTGEYVMTLNKLN